jgi:hypothetical protein
VDVDHFSSINRMDMDHFSSKNRLKYWEVDAQSGRGTSAILSQKLVMNQEPLPYAIALECAIALQNVLLFPIPALRHGIQT